jgi:ectoine hydroxylase-related dioxygenase (phytanoyl-CoA dioxygenase family)
MNPKKRVESVEDLRGDLAGRYRSNAPTPEGPPPAELAPLLEHGYVILENVLGEAELGRVREGVMPLLGPQGRNNFEGERTQRAYAVLAKTEACDPLVEHPRVLSIFERVLLPNYLLSQLQVINILPGETGQPLHYDDGFYPVPRPRKALSVATIWAIDDFTADNGATVILPRSHTWGDEVPPASAERIPVVMPAGSVVLFLGTLWHGGGANRTGKPRLAVSAQYCEPWTRTQENMFLAVPLGAVRKRSDAMRRMLGYSIHPPFVGMVNGQLPLRLLERGRD